MANYLTTDTDLTAVADAIREKGGTSAALAFPDEFVSAIGAIETGGGLPSFITKMESGTFSFVSDPTTTQRVAINHTLGAVPAGIVFYTNEFDPTDNSTVNAIVACFFAKTDEAPNIYERATFYLRVNNGAASTVGTTYSDYRGIRDITATSFAFAANANWYFKTGATYHWLAWA